MLVGVSAHALHPLAPHAAAQPSHEVRAFAFIPMPMVGPSGIRPSRHTGSTHARPTAFLPAVLPGSRPVSFPAVNQPRNWQPRASTKMQMVEEDHYTVDASTRSWQEAQQALREYPPQDALTAQESQHLLAEIESDAAVDSEQASLLTPDGQAAADDEDVAAVRARLRMLGPYPVLSLRFPDMVMPEQFIEEQKLTGETGVALDFVVDTAANVNTINAQLAKDLSLEPVGYEPAGVSAAGPLAGGSQYNLGNIQLNDLPREERFTLMTDLVASALPVASPSGAGILGINWLFSFPGGAEFNWGDPAAAAAATIAADAAAKKARAEAREAEAEAAEGTSDPTTKAEANRVEAQRLERERKSLNFSVVPSLTLYGELPGTAGLSEGLEEVPSRLLENGLVCVTIKINGVEIPALLDTGSPITVLNPAAAKAAGIEMAEEEPDQGSMNPFAKAASWFKQGADMTQAMQTGDVVMLGGGTMLRKIPEKADIALGAAELGQGRPYVGNIPGLAALDSITGTSMGTAAGPAAILGSDVLRQRKKLLLRDGKVFV